MNKFFALTAIAFVLIASACETVKPETQVNQTAAPEITKPEIAVITPTTDFSAALRTPRLSPSQYCSQQKVNPLAAAPVPFLYLPFNGSLTDATWSSQMDHDSPDYTRNGRLSALGEIGQFDRHDAEYPGGTIALNASNVFDYQTPIQTIEAQGFRILAYRLPLSEQFAFYDGHDGHDFAASGPALAAGDGVILFKGAAQNSLGNVVEIFHPQGYVTRYAHLMSFAPGIEIGTEVKAGDVVGQIGGSGYSNGIWNDNLWNVHLHFSVFRWDASSGTWAITDPFGWDPWAGPDLAARLQAQQSDPLVRCNGEVSYDLWVDFWPRNINTPSVTQAFLPSNDRYLGGYYYDEPVQPTPTATPEPVRLPVGMYPVMRSYLNSDPAGLSLYLDNIVTLPDGSVKATNVWVNESVGNYVEVACSEKNDDAGTVLTYADGTSISASETNCTSSRGQSWALLHGQTLVGWAIFPPITNAVQPISVTGYSMGSVEGIQLDHQASKVNISGELNMPTIGGWEDSPVRIFAHNIGQNKFFWVDTQGVNFDYGWSALYEFRDLPAGFYQFLAWFPPASNYPPMAWTPCSPMDWMGGACELTNQLKTIKILPGTSTSAGPFSFFDYSLGDSVDLWSAEPLP